MSRLFTSLSVYILAVVAAASGLLVVFYPSVEWNAFPQMALFIGLIAIASFLIIQDPSGGVISSTGTLFYVVIYVFEPITAFVIASLGYSIGNTLARNWVTYRVSFNAAQIGLSAFFGSLSYRALGGDLTRVSLPVQLLPALIGPLVHQVANNFFVAYLISQVRGIRFFKTWINFIRELFWSNLLSVPTAIIIAILYLRVHHSFALLFLLFLPFQRSVLRLYLEKRNTYARIIEQLVRATELSLPGTRGHAQRVASMSTKIARQMGLTERDIEAIEYGGLLHDIGMVGMDFMDTSSYGEDEEQLIDAHVRLGAEIVSELGRAEITEMILHHHTPFALAPARSSTSSLGARIVALAEDIDSRIHGLFPYSHPESMSSILESIEKERGHRFDPKVVDAFLILVHGDGAILAAPEYEGA